MTQVTKTLCEAICAEIGEGIRPTKSEPFNEPAFNLGLSHAQAIIRRHFAALSVEELAREICRAQFPGYSREDIERVKDGTVLWHSYRRSAQAVMKLLRKE